MKLNLSIVEVECLLLCIHQASNTYWTDLETRKAMKKFAGRFFNEVGKQLPTTPFQVTLDTLGDF